MLLRVWRFFVCRRRYPFRYLFLRYIEAEIALRHLPRLAHDEQQRAQCFTVTVTAALFPSLVAIMVAVPSLLPFTVAL